MAKLLPLRHKGNNSLFLAVEMSLISTLAGTPLHVHAEGLRGTGKDDGDAVGKACGSHDFPHQRLPVPVCAGNPHCPLHREAETSDGMVEEVPMPFVEIGHGAKLGTILEASTWKS